MSADKASDEEVPDKDPAMEAVVDALARRVGRIAPQAPDLQALTRLVMTMDVGTLAVLASWLERSWDAGGHVALVDRARREELRPY